MPRASWFLSLFLYNSVYSNICQYFIFIIGQKTSNLFVLRLQAMFNDKNAVIFMMTVTFARLIIMQIAINGMVCFGEPENVSLPKCFINLFGVAK